MNEIFIATEVTVGLFACAMTSARSYDEYHTREWDEHCRLPAMKNEEEFMVELLTAPILLVTAYTYLE